MKLKKRLAFPQFPTWFVTLMICCLALLFAGLRLWLVQAQNLRYQGFNVHDDMLFVQLAMNVRDTGWFGPFTNLTLAKGPFYPFFLAGNSLLGLPLLLTQNVLYILSVACICYAVRPLIKNDAITFGMFVLLLFQPASLDADANNRVLRAAPSIFLSLFTLAGLIKAFSTKLTLLSAIFLGPMTGLALAAFCLNREDAIWLAPAVLLILGASWGIQLSQRRALRPLFTFTTGFVCFLLGPILAVMLINAHFYQLFTITEFQHSAFPAAYGALLRVRPAQRMQYIPVTASTRYLLYSVSPTFREIAYPLEVYFAQGWAENSVDITGLPPEAKEIAGGWWMWALRDGVSGAGHYESANTAARYYFRLAQEINSLCDSGKLMCFKPHASMTPVLHVDDVFRIVPGFFQFFVSYFTSLKFSVYGEASSGDYALLQYQTITHETFQVNADAAVTSWQDASLNDKKLFVLDSIIGIFQRLMLPIVLLGIAGTFYSILQKDVDSVIELGLFASAMTLLVIVTIIHFTSFPAFGTLYLNALYPFLIISSILSITRTYRLIRKKLLLQSFHKAKLRIIHKGFDDLFRVHFMSQD